MALTPIRVICANTLGYVERRGDKGKDRMVKVSHTGDAASKMVEAVQTLLTGLIERFEAVATQYRRLKLTRLSEPASPGSSWTRSRPTREIARPSTPKGGQPSRW